MNKEINYNYKLPPFKWFCLANFPFIEADFDALTYYELLCKVVQYLNEVIVKTNAIGEQTEELTNAFNTLKEYVDTYFDNLDVQEEINNKLDAMVIDGTFSEIINQEIFDELNDKVNTNTTSIENIENDNAQKVNGGKIIEEIPFISVTNYTDIIYGSNSAIQISENGNDYIIVSASASFNDNNYQRYTVLNLNSETKSIINKEIAGGHSYGMIYKNNKIYDLLLPNKIYVYTTTALTDEDVITLNDYTLYGLTYDDINDKIYGLQYINNNLNILEIDSNDFSIIESHNINFNYRAGSQFQNLTYYKNALYIVFSNTLLKININTFEIEEQLVSTLKNCEYEDLVVVNNKPCILLQCGNEQAGFGIVQTNIDNNNYCYDNNFWRYQAEAIFVNSSATGFYETGITNASPIHYSLLASCFARSKGINRITICGDTDALNLSNYNGTVVSDTNTIQKIAICKVNNSNILFERVKITEYKNYGTYITYSSQAIYNSKLEFVNSQIDVSTHPYTFLACTIALTGGSTNLGYNCTYYYCSFMGDSSIYANNLVLSKDTTGKTTGENVTTSWSNDNFAILMRTGLFRVELATSPTADPSIYSIGAVSPSHQGTLYANGIDENGTPFICRVGGGKNILACKYADNTPLYIKNIYILPR